MRNFHRRAVSNYVEPPTRPESFDSFRRHPGVKQNRYLGSTVVDRRLQGGDYYSALQEE